MKNKPEYNKKRSHKESVYLKQQRMKFFAVLPCII